MLYYTVEKRIQNKTKQQQQQQQQQQKQEIQTCVIT